MKQFFQAPNILAYGIDGVIASDAWYLYSDETVGRVKMAVICVRNEWWVVKIDRHNPRDTPISGPFPTKDSAAVALRIIDAAEGT